VCDIFFGVGKFDFVAILNSLVELAPLEAGPMIFGTVDAFSWTEVILGAAI
jgi:hypothetical protein